MNENQNSSSVGDQMKDALADALRTGDFKNLNILVSQTVVNTVNEVKRQITPRTDEGRNVRQAPPPYTAAKPDSPPPFVSGTGRPMPPPFVPVWQQRLQEREAQRQRQQEFIAQQRRANSLITSVKFKRTGSVSNVLYQVFGGIGLGITGFITFIYLIATLSEAYVSFAGWIIDLLFLAGFFGMIRLGIFQRRRLRRAERYIQLCGEKRFADVDELAAATGRSIEFVKKDLHRMLELGMFPEGHLDSAESCFMLNDTVYRQYIEAERSRQSREPEPRPARTDPESEQEALSPEDAEMEEMAAEGVEFIRRLRDLNDKIPGEVISAKLFCLENLLKEIFDGVRAHPEQRHQMHKLMSYYLPTTLKLVEAYEEFDRVSAPGEDIIKAKAEIENTLDTINDAFRELLNKLFQHAAFDATTDAQVLKTMLAREGLMKEMDFATLSRE